MAINRQPAYTAPTAGYVGANGQYVAPTPAQRNPSVGVTASSLRGGWGGDMQPLQPLQRQGAAAAPAAMSPQQQTASVIQQRTGTGMGLAGPAPAAGYNLAAGRAQAQAMANSGNASYGKPTPLNPGVTGIVYGNQVYGTGLYNKPGGGGSTMVYDPTKTTYISGRTAPTALTGPGTDGRIGTNAPRALNGLGGGFATPGGGSLFNGGYGSGGIGAGGAGAQIGQGLQKDLDAANAANEARYQEALGVNSSGQAAQQAALDQNYGNIYNTINQNQTGQMGFLNGVLGQQQSLINGLGGTQHEEETRRLNSQLASNQQSLAGRGLGNSTVVDSMAKGYQSESAFNQRAIDDALNQQKLGILGQYGAQGGNILANTGQQMVGAQTGYAGAQQGSLAQNQAQRIGIIESKTDQGPNIQAYMNALSQAGSQGGAGGFAGGGGFSRGGTGGGTGFSLNYPNSGGGADNSPQGLLQQYIQSRMGNQQNGQNGGSFNFQNIPFTPAGGDLTRSHDGLPATDLSGSLNDSSFPSGGESEPYNPYVHDAIDEYNPGNFNYDNGPAQQIGLNSGAGSAGAGTASADGYSGYGSLRQALGLAGSNYSDSQVLSMARQCGLA